MTLRRLLQSMQPSWYPCRFPSILCVCRRCVGVCRYRFSVSTDYGRHLLLQCFVTRNLFRYRFGCTPGLEILSQIIKESVIPWTFPDLLCTVTSGRHSSLRDVCLWLRCVRSSCFLQIQCIFYGRYLRPLFLPCHRSCGYGVTKSCSGLQLNLEVNTP